MSIARTVADVLSEHHRAVSPACSHRSVHGAVAVPIPAQGQVRTIRGGSLHAVATEGRAMDQRALTAAGRERHVEYDRRVEGAHVARH